MTITTQDLIDAAKAIGIEAFIEEFETDGCLVFEGENDLMLWNPENDKSQLIDLYYRLQLDVNFYGGYLFHRNSEEFIEFADNFESFATAIILAAAEVGRGT